MTRFFCGFLLVFWILGPAQARPVPEGFSDLAQRLSPAVVNIAAERGRSAEGPDARSLGSGFVVDASGLIVTNNHVVEGASEIYVGFADGSRRAARLEGRDPKSDIALLRIWPDRKLSALTLGNSDVAKAGDWVLAIGNPFGLGGSVSAGIISARNRQLDTEVYDDFIQTDVAINRGSSGGPLFDREGRVVGVNSSLISPNGGSAGVSFAIPSNTVRVIVAQLRKYGHVRRGWIGANVQDLTPDLAAGFGLPNAIGALVAHVTPAGPAALSGLSAGDIVTRINSASVSDSRVMQRMIVEANVGQMLSLMVMRKGLSRQVDVRVARRADVGDVRVDGAKRAAEPALGATLGLDLELLTNDFRVRLGLGSDAGGAVVAGVAAGSPAAEADVKNGDLIQEVGQRRVRSPQDVKALIAAARAEHRPVVLIALNRGGEMMFKALRFVNRKVDGTLSTAKR